MDRADARAGLHCHHGFDRHRHVNQYAVAFFDTATAQGICHRANALVQIAVAYFGQRTVIGFENDRDLVRLRLQMAVEAVVGGVEFAVGKPFEKGRVRFIEYLHEGLLPQHVFAREACPEAGEILCRLGAQFVVGRHARDGRLFDESGGGRKRTGLVEHRFYGLVRHCFLLGKRWNYFEKL